MNLVAKEYVAAQNPNDPGVLVLSKFAGAADELDTALQVNPHDVEGMARTLATALAMPLNERRLRWEAMMAKLRRGSIQAWLSDFVEALQAAHDVNQQAAEPDAPVAPPDALVGAGLNGAPGGMEVWPLRSVNGREGVRFR
jgi:trehalose 6-phosphate synthase